jgi:ABC-2 type transport system ATP-binding protein
VIVERPLAPPSADVAAPSSDLVIAASGVSRRFGTKLALDDVSFSVRSGEVHALLGPNGAGKTTLLRILTGLLHADTGTVKTAGLDPVANPRELRERVGLVPSGDRTFYLRLSGLENLVFFARLYGFNRRDALARSAQLMERVGLPDALHVRVGLYSHGMQKRLSVARSLLAHPTILLVDEATHDLDPEGAARIRALVGELADEGHAVVWTTQRIEEIRGFAHRVTLLRSGRIAFNGTVPALMGYANPRQFFVQLELQDGDLSAERLNALIAPLGELARAEETDPTHFLLSLEPGVLLGEAVAALDAAGIAVVSCTEAQSKIEQAFLSLTGSSRTADVPEGTTGW